MEIQIHHRDILEVSLYLTLNGGRIESGWASDRLVVIFTVSFFRCFDSQSLLERETVLKPIHDVVSSVS